MDALERDVHGVFKLVHSLRNSFAPINRIPPDVISLIPDYISDEYYTYRDPVLALTQVCRCWREIFTSRPSLWTRFYFKNVDKTRTYIQRSKTSSLKFYLCDTSRDDAFSLIIPHLHRLNSLVVYSPTLLRHFRCHFPLLERLDICPHAYKYRELDGALFNGDLSSLRELRLSGVTTRFPWKNLANLKDFDLKYSRHIDLARLLGFFESAPRLSNVKLHGLNPNSSNTPPRRIVPLRHLNTFNISMDPSHPTLLNHLHIPARALLIFDFDLNRDGFSPLRHILEPHPNLMNLSYITTINIHFSSVKKFMRLSGPSGDLHVFGYWKYQAAVSRAMNPRILCTLGPSILSTAQRLALSEYTHPNPTQGVECPIFQTLFSSSDLRTLILNECDTLPFVLALDPGENSSGPLLCPNLEQLVLYIVYWNQCHVEYLMSMAKNRALNGAKLSSITIVILVDIPQGEEVFRLKEHVTHVECMFGGRSPEWSDLAGEEVLKSSRTVVDPC